MIRKIEPTGTIDLGGICDGRSEQVDLRIVDVRGNPMPVGTKIAVTTTDGTISGTGSFVQGNTNVTPPPFIGFSPPPSSGVANYTVFVRDDGVMTSTLNPVTGVTTIACVDPTASGVLTVTVTTPGGTITTAQFPVSN